MRVRACVCVCVCVCSLMHMPFLIHKERLVVFKLPTFQFLGINDSSDIAVFVKLNVSSTFLHRLTSTRTKYYLQLAKLN